MSKLSDDRLIWIDLEMTGLEPASERIIEIATIVTDGDLNLIAEGPVLAIHQPDRLLDAMDEWNTRTHGESGLVRRVQESRVMTADAERQTIAFLAEHVGEGVSPMCGNSVHQDRRFLQYEMPTLERFFHYRNIDVSTLKELARRWKPDILKGLVKKGSHQALDDIRESIEEMQYYRTHFLDLK
ncbi:oligoribonuclease [Larsenimonas rhizosphaerae]|uniref:Oligoribonuclease n=1 Tax=Larsenimonas rhizosphaerae TaxID=2944682 RepID=A0AA41ZHJ2_9GAMM|nr:oligoribonuclease [Larsenimonas rhizosphaerae]MCX2524695.1 oligoribonuclease [Larsenimonas rhizosphaerae]